MGRCYRQCPYETRTTRLSTRTTRFLAILVAKKNSYVWGFAKNIQYKDTLWITSFLRPCPVSHVYFLCCGLWAHGTFFFFFASVPRVATGENPHAAILPVRYTVLIVHPSSIWLSFREGSLFVEGHTHTHVHARRHAHTCTPGPRVQPALMI